MIRTRKYLSFCLVTIAGFTSSMAAYGWNGLAILGDSISTGAAAHPGLEYDPLALWRIMTGEIAIAAKASDIPRREDFKIGETLEAPRRLWPSNRENDGASGWVWLHAVQALSRTALDTEEYSYGYLTGRALGLASDKIWFAGDNGTRADRATLHAARVIENGDGELPTRIVMFYTGNDLCAQSWDTMTEASEYGTNLQNALTYLARNGRSAEGETTVVYLPAFLPVTALLNEPSISEKKIKFYGTELTCAEARKRMFAAPDVVISEDSKTKLPEDPRYSLFAQFMPPNPALLCPTLFAQTAQDGQRQSQLANRIRAYRDAQREAVRTFNKTMEERKTKSEGQNQNWARVEAKYIDTTEIIRFLGEDVGGDCFHLSAAGQGKIASALLKQMQ